MKIKERSTVARKKWQKICKGWEKSGLSPRKYCKENKIDHTSFYEWRRKINFPFPSDYREIAACKKWQKICEAWEASGFSATRYCKEKKVPKSEFVRWRKKINFPFFKKPKRVIHIHNWDEIIKDWEKSNLSVRKYCMEKNIPSTSLYKRRRKINHPSYMNVQDRTHKWGEIIKDWEGSGLTPRMYCMKHTLSYSTFLRWDKEFNPQKFRQTIQEKAFEKWTKIFEDWETSGLSGFAFCQRKGITPSSFQKWKKKLNDSENSPLRLDFTRQEHPDVSLEDYFVSMPFSSAVLMGSPPANKKIEVMFPQGHQLRMEGQFDWEILNSWLTLLLSLGEKEKGNDHGKKTI